MPKGMLNLKKNLMKDINFQNWMAFGAGLPSCVKFEDGQRSQRVLFTAQNLETTTNAIHEVSVSLLK